MIAARRSAAAAARNFRSPRRTSRGHRIAISLWVIIGLATVGIALFYPVRFTALNLALVAGGFITWLGALVLIWRWLPLRVLFLAASLAPAGLLFLDEKKIEKEPLRVAYLHSLESYKGTPYIWGGETRTGIDCSGLLRASLMEAELREGVRTQNVALLRKAASLWWFDFSAKAMGETYQGRTLPIVTAQSLNDAPYEKIVPGDMAVTEGGQHVLTYLGDQVWIQAEPAAGRVITTRAPSDQGWFGTPVQLLRWRILEKGF